MSQANTPAGIAVTIPPEYRKYNTTIQIRSEASAPPKISTLVAR
jgi:hypothetical protein